MLSHLTRTSHPRRRRFLPLPERLEARECPSGELLDPTFNGGAPETSGRFDLASATAIQPDGKLVAAGGTWNGTDDDWALARYLGSATATAGAPSPAAEAPGTSTSLPRSIASGD